jgi:hypothetical protein
MILTMMSVKLSVKRELTRGTEVLGPNTHPSATLSTTNFTWPDLGSNPDRRGGKPATNLSYGTAMGRRVSLGWEKWRDAGRWTSGDEGPNDSVGVRTAVGKSVALLDAQDGSMFLWKVGKLLPKYTVSDWHSGNVLGSYSAVFPFESRPEYGYP